MATVVKATNVSTECALVWGQQAVCMRDQCLLDCVGKSLKKICVSNHSVRLDPYLGLFKVCSAFTESSETHTTPSNPTCSCFVAIPASILGDCL